MNSDFKTNGSEIELTNVYIKDSVIYHNYTKENLYYSGRYNDFNTPKDVDDMNFYFGWRIQKNDGIIPINPEIIEKPNQLVLCCFFDKHYVHCWESLLPLYFKKDQDINDVYILNYSETDNLPCNVGLVNYLRTLLPKCQFHFNCKNGIFLSKCTLVGRRRLDGLSGNWFQNAHIQKEFIQGLFNFYNIKQLDLINKKEFLVGIIIRKGSREIKNIDFIKNNVKSLGGKTIDLDYNNMTFKEQIINTHKVNILIGSHGAGLVNSLFLRDKSAVIEINSYMLVDHYYSNLIMAKSSDLFYQFVQSYEFPHNILSKNINPDINLLKFRHSYIVSKCHSNPLIFNELHFHHSLLYCLQHLILNNIIDK